MIEGILLINKPSSWTSFRLVSILRKRLNVRKIGHAGTLDPFATGVMVLLVGKNYTRLSDTFLNHDKEYVAQLRLGISTDTYDCDGEVIASSSEIPDLAALKEAIQQFQGSILQVPPMFSAKKIGGKKLCDLARKGITIERKAVSVNLEIDLLNYEYPFVDLRVKCSKGTYIRSLAHDLGLFLKCGAHLSRLQRTKSGPFLLEECIEREQLESLACDLRDFLKDVK